MKIEYENISVKLSIPAREEFVTEKEVLDRIIPTYRPYFKVNLEEDESFSGSQDSADRFGPGKKYTRRTNLSSYSHFKNITYSECIKELTKSPNQGIFVVRPSPQGESYLNLTIKYYQNQFVHINIEEIKDEDSKSQYKLGTQIFDSLEEIEFRYVKEFNKKVNEATTNRKFVQVNTFTELEEYVKNLKSRDKEKFQYNFSLIETYPQHLVLVFCPSTENTNAKREFIKIKQNGYFFHNKLHKRLEDLIFYFKTHFTTKQYRKEMLAFRNYSPRSKIKTGIELDEPEGPSAANEWQDENIADETPFPEKTAYIPANNTGGESGWGGDSSSYQNNVAQFSTFEKNDEWGESMPRNRGSFAKPEDRNDDWNASNNNSYSQNSNSSNSYNRRGRGGFRGRGRGRGGDRGGGDRACFKCGETGHFARECPSNDDSGGGYNNNRGGYNRRGRGGGRFNDDGGFRSKRRDFSDEDTGGGNGWGRRDDDRNSNKNDSEWGGGDQDNDNKGGESGWGAGESNRGGNSQHAFGRDDGNGSSWGGDGRNEPKEESVGGDDAGW